MENLRDIQLSHSTSPLTPEAEALIADANRIAKTVKCFDFVPSNYERAWRTLDALPRRPFCEWGSGLGIVTGLAELLGFEAVGTELDIELCRQSRELLTSHGLKATIAQGDYFASEIRSDIYYVYCWPSLLEATLDHFAHIAAPDSLLLICYGQDDIRGHAK